MARKPRIDYPGAWHHVMHRGARHAPIFRSNDDGLRFLGAVSEVVRRFELEVHAYALMPNHYHLLVHSRHGNLSRAMRHLNAVYTQASNRARSWDGPLFRGRFRSQLLRNHGHLPYVFAYIHLNPLRANLVTRLTADSWTSFLAYVGRERAPQWLSRSYFLELFGSAVALQRHVLDLHRGRRPWPEQLALDTGWVAVAEPSEGCDQDASSASSMSAQAALDLVRGITGASLPELRQVARGPRANPARRFAVWALGHGTLLAQREIGKVLGMTTAQVANVLRRQRNKMKQEPFTSWSEAWEAALLLYDK